jgi:peptide/nickel transport system substrate-binding protein
VRLANLQAGDLELIERPAPTDLEAIRNDPNLELASAPSLGYQGLTINLSNPEPLGTPLASNPQVREALELALDRNIINQAVLTASLSSATRPCRPAAPGTTRTTLSRTQRRAGAGLCKRPGSSAWRFELMVGNDPQSVRLGEVIQALGAEAGSTSPCARPSSPAPRLSGAGRLRGLSDRLVGPLDPDGNIHQYNTCEGSLKRKRLL